MTDSIFHGLAIGLSLLASVPARHARSRRWTSAARWPTSAAPAGTTRTRCEIQGERHLILLSDMELIDGDHRLTPTGEQLRLELTLPVHMSLVDIAAQLNPGGAEAVRARGRGGVRRARPRSPSRPEPVVEAAAARRARGGRRRQRLPHRDVAHAGRPAPGDPPGRTDPAVRHTDPERREPRAAVARGRCTAQGRPAAERAAAAVRRRPPSPGPPSAAPPQAGAPGAARPRPPRRRRTGTSRPARRRAAAGPPPRPVRPAPLRPRRRSAGGAASDRSAHG